MLDCRGSKPRPSRSLRQSQRRSRRGPGGSVRDRSGLSRPIVSPSTRASAPLQPRRPHHHPSPKLQKKRPHPHPHRCHCPRPKLLRRAFRRQNPHLLLRTMARRSSLRIESGGRVPLPAACTFSAFRSLPAPASSPKKLSGEWYPTPAPPRANQPDAAIVPRRFGSTTRI
jgi:hypothetical protein